LSIRPKLQDQDQVQTCKTKTKTASYKTKTSFCWSETGLVTRPRSQTTTLQNTSMSVVVLSSFVHCVSKMSQILEAVVSTCMDKLLVLFGKQHHHTFENDTRIQLFLSLHFYLLYLHLNSCDGNDGFWHHSMLVKQFNSFSREHRILSLQICVRQTVRLTRKLGRLQNLATDVGMCVHCTRHNGMAVTPAT